VRKNSQHAFLRRGCKAVCPMLKIPTMSVEVVSVG
jgi:hypothetical protein